MDISPDTTLVLRIDGMHCGSCALLIDETLQDLPGVRDATTSRRKGQSTVRLEPNHRMREDVVKDVLDTITSLGYRAAPLP
jgi:copper chaperone